MGRLVAVIEQNPDDQVRPSARALARLLDAEIEELSLVGEQDDRERVTRVLDALTRPEVVGSVVSAHPKQAVYLDVVAATTKPVLVIPVTCAQAPSSITRILLPLDGSASAAAGVADFARKSITAGTEVFAVHVFEPRTVPAFWDHPAHSFREWEAEFRTRNLPEQVHLELRRGRPADVALAEAGRKHVDLLVLAWSQDLTTHSAAVVREALCGSPVPVLMFRDDDTVTQ